MAKKVGNKTEKSATKQELHETSEAILAGIQEMFDDLYKFLEKKFNNLEDNQETLNNRVKVLEDFKRRITTS